MYKISSISLKHMVKKRKKRTLIKTVYANRGVFEPRRVKTNTLPREGRLTCEYEFISKGDQKADTVEDRRTKRVQYKQ